MSNWGYALAQGLAAGAQSASGMLDAQMKREDQEAADVRAANRKLDMESRLNAAKEAMQERAEERKRQASRAQGQEITSRAQGMLEAGNQAVIDRVNADPRSAPMTKEELAGMPEETRKLYGAPDTGELASLKREAAAAREIGDTAREKEINDRIKDLETVNRNNAKDAAEERRHQERMKHDERMVELKRKADAGDAKATADMKNIDDIAETLFDGDRAQAYAYKASMQGKSRTEVVKSMLPLVKDDYTLDTPEKRLQAAERLADSLMSRETSTKAAVRGAPAKPTTATPPANRPPLSSFRMN